MFSWKSFMASPVLSECSARTLGFLASTVARCVAQLRPLKRLLQQPKTLVVVWQALRHIAGRKDEGHAARGERVGNGVALLPVEIDIEHRRVDGLSVNHRQSLRDAGGGTDDRAA